jgi:hypothetical protein
MAKEAGGPHTPHNKCKEELRLRAPRENEIEPYEIGLILFL